SAAPAPPAPRAPGWYPPAARRRACARPLAPGRGKEATMKMIPWAMVPESPNGSRVKSLVTEPVDVQEIEAVVLDVRRPSSVETAPAFEVTLQESPDRTSWAAVEEAAAVSRPADGAEIRCRAALRHRWLRLVIAWSGLAAAAASEDAPSEIRVDG